MIRAVGTGRLITLLIIDDLAKIPLTPDVIMLDVMPAAAGSIDESRSPFIRDDLLFGIDYERSDFLGYQERYREARRTKGLPSYTEARFAPAAASHRPPERILVTGFVRGYQRHREGRTKPEVRVVR